MTHLMNASRITKVFFIIKWPDKQHFASPSEICICYLDIDIIIILDIDIDINI